MDDYLPRILRARVYDVAVKAARVGKQCARLNNHVWLKREDLPVFSFKLRGAYNRMAQLSEQERARGVIAASTTACMPRAWLLVPLISSVAL